MGTRASDRPSRSGGRPWWRSRWWMPAFSLFLGVLILAAFSIGGNARDGVMAFAVMAAVAALFLFGSRSASRPGPPRPRSVSSASR